MNGVDAVKTILAGASAFQVVSALYVYGNDYISTILKEIENWMDKKGYAEINDFKGKLSRKNLTDPFAYRRSQYVDIIMKSEQYLMRKTLH
jgi:dihydroorotate dehydrogenase (fumarate)